MPSPSRPQILFGGSVLGSPKCSTAAEAKAWTDLFHSYGHTTIDTALSYPIDNPGASEKVIAEAGVNSWATIDTKVSSMGEKVHNREHLFESMEASLASLGFKAGGKGKERVDIMYLHMPCPDVPFEETMGAMNEAYQKGMFKRLGISNYSPNQVEELVRITKENGWVQPTVYQGQYNPITRQGENTLFPILRKHGIAFYAYTPTGAGIFSGKVSQDSIHTPSGRFSHETPIGQYIAAVYLRPELLDAANKVHTAAQEHGINGHEVALRWVLHHSALKAEHGDATIIGASNLKQLETNLKMCDQGPLPEDLVKVVEDVWTIAGPVAPWAWIEGKTSDIEQTMQESVSK